jgi:hypothetical protein
MGAALNYARQYALFTLVGLAGEDDLDAPDLGLPGQAAGVPIKSGEVNGSPVLAGGIQTLSGSRKARLLSSSGCSLLGLSAKPEARFLIAQGRVHPNPDVQQRTPSSSKAALDSDPPSTWMAWTGKGISVSTLMRVMLSSARTGLTGWSEAMPRPRSATSWQARSWPARVPGRLTECAPRPLWVHGGLV